MNTVEHSTQCSATGFSATSVTATNEVDRSSATGVGEISVTLTDEVVPGNVYLMIPSKFVIKSLLNSKFGVHSYRDAMSSEQPLSADLQGQESSDKLSNKLYLKYFGQIVDYCRSYHDRKIDDFEKEITLDKVRKDMDKISKHELLVGNKFFDPEILLEMTFNLCRICYYNIPVPRERRGSSKSKAVMNFRKHIFPQSKMLEALSLFNDFKWKKNDGTLTDMITGMFGQGQEVDFALRHDCGSDPQVQVVGVKRLMREKISSNGKRKLDDSNSAASKKVNLGHGLSSSSTITTSSTRDNPSTRRDDDFPLPVVPPVTEPPILEISESINEISPDDQIQQLELSLQHSIHEPNADSQEEKEDIVQGSLHQEVSLLSDDGAMDDESNQSNDASISLHSQSNDDKDELEVFAATMGGVVDSSGDKAHQESPLGMEQMYDPRNWLSNDNGPPVFQLSSSVDDDSHIYNSFLSHVSKEIMVNFDSRASAAANDLVRSNRKKSKAKHGTRSQTKLPGELESELKQFDHTEKEALFKLHQKRPSLTKRKIISVVNGAKNVIQKSLLEVFEEKMKIIIKDSESKEDRHDSFNSKIRELYDIEKDLVKLAERQADIAVKVVHYLHEHMTFNYLIHLIKEADKQQTELVSNHQFSCPFSFMFKDLRSSFGLSCNVIAPTNEHDKSPYFNLKDGTVSGSVKSNRFTLFDHFRRRKDLQHIIGYYYCVELKKLSMPEEELSENTRKITMTRKG